MEQAEEFDLKELCEAAHVTERTVRYYIAEGLLPPPVGVRSQSRYTAAHLERLQLIQQLKEQDFSLRQIKQLLAGKDTASLQPLLDPAYLADEVVEPIPAQPLHGPIGQSNFNEPSGGPGVFQALNRLDPNFDRRGDTRPTHSLKMGFTRSWTTGTPQIPTPESGTPEETHKAEAELSHLWEKFSIAPGIELMLDKTIADQHRASLAALAEQIKSKLGQ